MALPVLQTTNPTQAAVSGVAFPKSAITVVILAGAVLIGAVTAKLVDLIHDRRSLRDGASDISEYTQNLLKMRFALTTTTTVAKPLSTDPVTGQTKKSNAKLAWFNCCYASSCRAQCPSWGCFSRNAAVSGSGNAVDVDVHVDLEARGALTTDSEDRGVEVLAYTETSGRLATMDVVSVACKVGSVATSGSTVRSVAPNKGACASTSAEGLNQVILPKEAISSAGLDEAMDDDTLGDAGPLEPQPRGKSGTSRSQSDQMNRTSTPVEQSCSDQFTSGAWPLADFVQSSSTDLAAVHRPSTVSGMTDFCSGSMMSVYHGEHPLDSQYLSSLADSQITVAPPNEPVSETDSIASFGDSNVTSGVDSSPSTVVSAIMSAANSNGCATIASTVDINTSATVMRTVDSNNGTTVSAITSAVDSSTGCTVDTIKSTVDSNAGITVNAIKSAVDSSIHCTVDTITSTVDSNAGTTVNTITSAVDSSTACTVDAIKSTVDSNAGTTVNTITSAVDGSTRCTVEAITSTVDSNVGRTVTSAVDSNTGTTVGVIRSAVDSKVNGAVSGVENHRVGRTWNKTMTKRLKSGKGWTASSTKPKPVPRAYLRRPSVVSYLDAARTYLSAFDRRPQTGRRRTRGESDIVADVINGKMSSAGNKKKRAKTAGQISTRARALSSKTNLAATTHTH